MARNFIVAGVAKLVLFLAAVASVMLIEIGVAKLVLYLAAVANVMLIEIGAWRMLIDKGGEDNFLTKAVVAVPCDKDNYQVYWGLYTCALVLIMVVSLLAPTDKRSQWRLTFELQIKYGELERQCAVLRRTKKFLEERTHQLTESQKKVQELKQRNEELGGEVQERGQRNEELEEKVQELKQRNEELEEKTKQQNKWSQQKERELEEIEIKLDEILEQRSKLKCVTELDRYELGEAPRGICFVINNFKFRDHRERHGAKVDEEMIEHLFDELHFKVEIRQNLGRLEILKETQEMAARDHSKYGAFVFCIMSHGDEKDVIYGVDDREVAVENLMSEFKSTNCKSLENKPKLFFIQACRGQRSDPRMSRLSASTENIAEDGNQTMDSPDADIANGISAREADFLLAFATVPGYRAWRSKIVGSWFIQELVDVIRMHHHHHHLLDMLTEVNQRVAKIANDYPDTDLSYQVPSPTHTLRAQVFL